MKFSSALTVTTVISAISTVQGAPIQNTEPVHHRRHSSVSELSGRTFQGADLMDNFGPTFEHVPGIARLLNFVKRQMGSTDSTSASAGGSTSGGSSGGIGPSSGETVYNPAPSYVQTDDPDSPTGGLMGGDLSSPQDAGFAFEPGQGIRALT